MVSSWIINEYSQNPQKFSFLKLLYLEKKTYGFCGLYIYISWTLSLHSKRKKLKYDTKLSLYRFLLTLNDHISEMSLLRNKFKLEFKNIINKYLIVRLVPCFKYKFQIPKFLPKFFKIEIIRIKSILYKWFELKWSV